MYQDLPRSVRLWGMACHLSAIVCAPCNCVLIPFVSLIVPYLVWIGGRDQHPFVDDQGRESLNFQISMAIYAISIGILFIFLFLMTCGIMFSLPSSGNSMGIVFNWLFVGLVSIVALFGFFQIAVIILAAVKAYNGQSYRYPFTLGFLH
ncbi:DUF4870 domain-containing protein [Phormidesmis sp. 146-35]